MLRDRAIKNHLSLDSLSNSFYYLFTLEDIYNYFFFLNAHDVMDNEYQLLPIELLLQYMFVGANHSLHISRIINEGRNVTKYVLLKESQNVSISFFS